jgi:hypothetical protein
MTKRRWAGVVVFALVAAASPGRVSAGAAARSHECTPMTGRVWQVPNGPRSGKRYQVGVIGTAFTCAKAKVWVAKLINDRINDPVGAGVDLHNGPAGYRCHGNEDKEGYAFAGACTKGSLVKPTSGFSWGGG